MNLYTWRGEGVFLGATVVAIAESLPVAKKIVKKQVTSMGLEFKSFVGDYPVDAKPFCGNEVVYYDNGDY